MTITPKEKELAAVGISVAAGCKPCTDHHVGVARKARASDQEIKEAVGAALAVRKSATEIIAGHALAKLGDPEQQRDDSSSAETSRQRELVVMGAAFAVNCVSSLEAHLAAADAVGITQEEITQIVKLAAFIKEPRNGRRLTWSALLTYRKNPLLRLFGQHPHSPAGTSRRPRAFEIAARADLSRSRSQGGDRPALTEKISRT